IAANIGDLGKDATCDAKGRRPERFADGESDKAATRQIAGNEQKDEKHDQQLDRHEQHADAHTRLQGYVVTWPGLAGKCRKSGTGVGESINAHTEGGHTETARDTHHAEQQNDRDLISFKTLQEAEIKDDDDRYEGFQDAEKLPLRGKVGLT